ncbi:MAG: hypothetical protein PWR24_775 [Desulfonauticus sp.]|jgi:hypothetical protein|nr:hypothetical protein [Desulfonauticus sp.]
MQIDKSKIKAYLNQANSYLCVIRKIGKDNYYKRFKREVNPQSHEVLSINPKAEVFKELKKQAKEYKEKYFKNKIVLGSVLDENLPDEEFLRALKIVLTEYEEAVYVGFVNPCYKKEDLESLERIVQGVGIEESFYIKKQTDPHFGYFVIDVYLNPFDYTRKNISAFRQLIESNSFVFLRPELPKVQFDKKYNDNELINFYINESLDMIPFYKATQKYPKVSFTRDDFWNFSLLKDNKELFLSYDKIMEEKNLELLIEILRRFDNIKIIASGSDYNKLMIDNNFENRIIINDDVYERAYRSDFFVLFEDKKSISNFVFNFTFSRPIRLKIDFPEKPQYLISAENYEKNVKSKIFNERFGKLIDYKPENMVDLMWLLIKDCFSSYEEFNEFYYLSSTKEEYFYKRILLEINNPKLMYKIRILKRLSRVKQSNRS